MKVRDLNIHPGAMKIIRNWGIEELYPPQSDCVKDVIDGKNCVLAFPTASGKSLLAYISVIKRVIEEGGKALYIVPLRALASEKVEDLKAFSELGLKVAVSMGDYDRPDPKLKNFDVIVATSEKADSLLRQNVDWLKDLNLMIADEVHLINDRDRGATLEVTLSKLKQVNPGAQIIALSATIRNSDAVASWLDAEHHTSDWRPVELSQGVYYKQNIYFEDESIRDVKKGHPSVSLCTQTIEEGGQCLVFVSTRKSTESLCMNVGPEVRKRLRQEEQEELKKIAKRLDEQATTSFGKRLATMVSMGVAFHNAGLNNEQRNTIEKAFKDRLIKVIVATPTLAAGINLPARRVIIRDWRRYDPLHGFNTALPVMEVKQMCGRAGRPGYDDVGEAIIVAKRKNEVRALIEQYIWGESEVVVSRLTTETSLRKHLLALISTQHCSCKEDIDNFISGTFLARGGLLEGVWSRIDETIYLLEEYGLLKVDGETLKATPFGKKVSDLYIDPISGIRIKKALESGRQGISLSYLHVICDTPDIYTLFLRTSEINKLMGTLDRYRADLFEEPPEDQGDLEAYLTAFKTATMLNDWIEEVSEDDIANRYDIGPGDIRNRVETAEWLLHSAAEIARMYDSTKASKLRDLTSRMKYGIKEELLPLMKIKQVGRVRARTLFDAGYRTAEDVSKATADELRKLPGIGERLSSEVTGPKPQTSLKDF